MSTDIWYKYRHESDQTITVIGVLILSAKLCVADDHFSIKEEEEILKIVPHEPRQKKLLLRILDAKNLEWKSHIEPNGGPDVLLGKILEHVRRGKSFTCRGAPGIGTTWVLAKVRVFGGVGRKGCVPGPDPSGRFLVARWTHCA